MHLIYGSSGWIGSMICKLLDKQGKKYVCGKARLENRQEIEKEVDFHNPSRVINASGKTGRPNVDWCESNKLETFGANVTGVINLAMICRKRNIHLTQLGSGCIYTSKDGEIYTEEDTPNFTDSFYSFTKVQAEKCLAVFKNILILRLRMPISDDLSERCFVTKITKYEKVINVPNSMSVLSDLSPILIDMSEKKITGIYNFCNPGFISHNEILSMYKEFVDPNFTWKNFTVEEQNKVIKAPRSNCLLSTEKLEKLYKIPDIHDSVRECLQKIGKK